MDKNDELMAQLKEYVAEAQSFFEWQCSHIEDNWKTIASDWHDPREELLKLAGQAQLAFQALDNVLNKGSSEPLKCQLHPEDEED